jgi:hypothetical protein
VVFEWNKIQIQNAPAKPLPMKDQRLHAPAALRNRDLILSAVEPYLPASGLILEVASGSGQHCIWFAEKLPQHVMQPSDPDPKARASIGAWIASAGVRNIREPIALDAAAKLWPLTEADAIFCINMVHISPWSATLGLLDGAARLLPPTAPLCLYGPYRRGGAHTSESNAAFDRDLRGQNHEWGVRDLEALGMEAAARGFLPPAIIEMPANNLTLVFRKRADLQKD